MSAPNPIAREIERAVASIGQIKASALLREMREREEAQRKARKVEKRRLFELGALVMRCGLKDWDNAELAGLLADGKVRGEQSQTMRLSFRKRGELFLNPPASATLHWLRFVRLRERVLMVSRARVRGLNRVASESKSFRNRVA